MVDWEREVYDFSGFAGGDGVDGEDVEGRALIVCRVATLAASLEPLFDSIAGVLFSSGDGMPVLACSRVKNECRIPKVS